MTKTIHVPAVEFFNETTSEFFITKERDITICHSLVSISKWESIWKRSFFNKGPSTREELLSYIKCMTITQNVSDDVYAALSNENFNEISDYIDDTMTATTFSAFRGGNKQPQMTITSEVIYYRMIKHGIPVDIFQKWHINRLLTLLTVFDEIDNPQKMSKEDVASTYAELNKQRRAAAGSKG